MKNTWNEKYIERKRTRMYYADLGTPTKEENIEKEVKNIYRIIRGDSY